MSCQAIQLQKSWQEAMIRVLARTGPPRCLLWGTRLVSDWWTMTSTHRAWWGGNPIKADVGGGGLQTVLDKIAESSHKPITFDRALQRKKARQKRHRKAGNIKNSVTDWTNLRKSPWSNRKEKRSWPKKPC